MVQVIHLAMFWILEGLGALIIKQSTVLCNLALLLPVYILYYGCVTISREMACLAKVCDRQVLYICLCEYTTQITCVTSDTKTVKLPVCLFLLGSTSYPQSLHAFENRAALWRFLGFTSYFTHVEPRFHSNEKWQRREYHSHLRAGLAGSLRPGSPQWQSPYFWKDGPVIGLILHTLSV